jgi:uncharacterized membrane protein
MLYFVLKWLHLMGAAVLLGTGAGIAFFMLMAHLTRCPTTIAAVTRIVIIADFLFTATAVVAQPATGIVLASEAGYSARDGWIVLSILLYLFAGAFWCQSSGCRSECAISLRPRRWRNKPCRNPIIGCSIPGSASAFLPSGRCWRSSG